MNGINRAGLVLITELTSLNQPEPEAERIAEQDKVKLEP